MSQATATRIFPTGEQNTVTLYFHLHFWATLQHMIVDSDSDDSYRTSVQGEIQITAHYLHSISSNMAQWLQRVAELKLDKLLLENMHL